MTELENKVKLLRLKISKTEETLPKQDRQALERHQASISSIVSAVDELKSVIEEGKIGKGESEDVAAWSQEIEHDLEKADETTRKIQGTIKAIDQEEQEREAVEKHKKNMVFELQLLEQRAEFDRIRDQEKAAANKAEHLKSSVAAKLPKLSITKFSGKVEDWFPFWGKFTSEIDTSNLAKLTKAPRKTREKRHRGIAFHRGRLRQREGYS